MFDLYGTKMGRAEFLDRVGDVSQVCDVRRVRFSEGTRAGIEAVDITTGSGLAFTVLPSRALDISTASWKGVPLAWRSPTLETAPWMYDSREYEWLRTFFGGLLTTCGMAHASHPCVDEGESLGLHGRISNLSAEDVSISREWRGDDYHIAVSGRVREAKVFGENLILHRTIETALGSRSLLIRDRIENAGFRSSPLMMLYHVNIGWPILSGESRLLSPTLRVNPLDTRAAGEPDVWNAFAHPSDGYAERVYLHDMAAGSGGMVELGLVNDHLGLGVRLRYPLGEFPRFVEWKMLGRGEYVVGIEPGNITGNRAAMRRDGTLEYLEPGAEHRFTLEISVLEGQEAIETLDNTVNATLKTRQVNFTSEGQPPESPEGGLHGNH